MTTLIVTKGVVINNRRAAGRAVWYNLNIVCSPSDADLFITLPLNCDKVKSVHM